MSIIRKFAQVVALSSFVFGSFASSAFSAPAPQNAVVEMAQQQTLIAQNQISLPATGERRDNVAVGTMYTKFTLNPDGTLNVNTEVRNRHRIKGFTGGVAIVLTDIKGETIWNSEQQQYGINPRYTSRKEKVRNENWSARVPLDVLSQVAGHAIIQEHTPRDRFGEWLKTPAGQLAKKAAIYYFKSQFGI